MSDEQHPFHKCSSFPIVASSFVVIIMHHIKCVLAGTCDFKFSFISDASDESKT